MATFINPFVDRAFKLIFGREENKDLLIDLLNGLFEGERLITELSFMNVEEPAESTDSRGAVFDLKCKDTDGTTFIIEIQNAPQSYFYERGLYYLCRIISGQDEKSDKWKFTLYPVYGIFLLNFKSGRADKLRTDIVLADRETGRQMSDTIHQVYLEMPFFTKEEAECKTSLDYWLYTLIHMENLESLPFKGKKELFTKLERLARIVNLNKKERAEYEESLKIYRDNQGVLDYALESGFAKGKAEGKAEGLVEGELKGKVEGKVEGKAEGLAEGLAEGELRTKKEIATIMKQNGMDIQSISVCTGLTVEEIKTL